MTDREKINALIKLLECDEETAEFIYSLNQKIKSGLSDIYKSQQKVEPRFEGFNNTELDVDNTNLSVRVKNALKNNYIYNLEALSFFHENDLYKLSGFGESAIKELANELQRLGIKLASGPIKGRRTGYEGSIFAREYYNYHSDKK